MQLDVTLPLLLRVVDGEGVEDDEVVLELVSVAVPAMMHRMPEQYNKAAGIVALWQIGCIFNQRGAHMQCKHRGWFAKG